MGLALQLVALAALPQVLALALAPVTTGVWDGPEVGLALVPLVTVLLLFACGRAFVRGDHPVPLVAAYLAVSVVLAVASLEIVGRDDPHSAVGVVADALAGPVAILAGVLLFARRAASPAPRAEAGAMVLVAGATSVIALGFAIAGELHGDVHATPGTWFYFAITWAAGFAVATLAIRAGRALLAGAEHARRALQIYVVAAVAVTVVHTLLAVSFTLVERAIPLRLALPIQLIALVGIATPLVIWHHANRDLAQAPAPARSGARSLAWLAWWFVPQLAVRAITAAIDPALGGPLALVIVQGVCLAAAAALALTRTRGARLAALAAAAASFIAIAALVRDMQSVLFKVPWWVVVLPFTTTLALAWLEPPD